MQRAAVQIERPDLLGCAGCPGEVARTRDGILAQYVGGRTESRPTQTTISKLTRLETKVAARNKRYGELIRESSATTTYSVKMSPCGIGDNVLAACVMPGLMRLYPGRVFYDPSTPGWVEALFDVPLSNKKADKTFWPFNSFSLEIATRSEQTRAELYSAKCRNVVPEFPPLKSFAKSPMPGAYVICPSTTSANRVWHHWGKLEQLLLAKGVRTVVTAKSIPNTMRFRGELFLSQNPSEVVALLASAKCVVAADTGLAHVALATKTRTIVLCGPTDGHKVFDKRVYPTVEVVNGKPVNGATCAGCYWHNTISPACGGYCASLNKITPEEVCEQILNGGQWQP